MIFGRADAKLIIHDENQDVTYASNIVDLLFFPYQTRGQAEVPGRTQYFVGGSGSEKVPTVIWTVRGSRGGCTVEGEARVTLPIWDPTRDPTHLAFGYMVVVEPGSGDFHSVLVKAFDADAYYTQTCPGNPPVITKVPFEAGYLLHIPWQKNDRVGDRVIYKGHKSYDQSDTLDFLNLLPPGTTLPQIALDALSQMSGSGTSRRYHWNWELHPVRVGD